MKKFIFILLLVPLISCSQDNSVRMGNIIVEGNMQNDIVAWHNYLPDIFKKAFAADTISTRSTLVVTDPERFLDVNIITGITVDANVINTTAVSIKNYKVDIFIEDEQQITKEIWACNVCYAGGGATACQSLYEIQGNTIFESEPEPELPLCQAGLYQQELCVTVFPEGLDCSAPTYSIDYIEPGSGLIKYSLDNVSVAALSNIVSSASVQSSGWLTGTDKYARFILYNQFSVQVYQKDYIFNVVE